MTVPYTPALAPDTQDDLPLYLRSEFGALKRGLEAAWDYGEQRYLTAAPPRIRAGMIVLADGVVWNPGSGEGAYRRNLANTLWVFLG